MDSWIQLLDQKICDRIRQERVERGLKQYSLAVAIGKSRSVVTDIEAGKRPVRASELYMIERALGLQPGSILLKVHGGPS